MLSPIILTPLEESMQEATLVRWHVQEGSQVEQGTPLADFTYGGNTLLLTAREPGEVVVLRIAEGAIVDVGTLLAVLDRAPAALGEPSPSVPGKSVKVRRIIARKMQESWRTVPHFFVTVAVDMTDVIGLRKSLGVTINDFILAATVRSLREHPWVNSLWLDGEAVEQAAINLAMAVATEGGLYYPVLADCGRSGLRELSRRAAELATKDGWNGGKWPAAPLPFRTWGCSASSPSAPSSPRPRRRFWRWGRFAARWWWTMTANRASPRCCA